MQRSLAGILAKTMVALSMFGKWLLRMTASHLTLSAVPGGVRSFFFDRRTRTNQFPDFKDGGKMPGRSTMEGAGACANVPLMFVSLVWLTIALVFGPAAQAQNPAPNSPVTVLFSFFAESTSNQPISMIKARSGIFYGTTIGGEGNTGSVFSITEDGSFTTLHFFEGADGDFPYGRLVEGNDSNFYGTTIWTRLAFSRGTDTLGTRECAQE